MIKAQIENYGDKKEMLIELSRIERLACWLQGYYQAAKTDSRNHFNPDVMSILHLERWVAKLRSLKWEEIE